MPYSGYSKRQVSCHGHGTLTTRGVYVELLTIATQLLATYCANTSASERAFPTCEADSKRESRNAGAVGGDVS